MRKITKLAIDAFMNAEKFNKDNTVVRVEENVTVLELFGNPIAYRYNDPEKTLTITTAGWDTVTTRERLNGIPGVSVYKKGGVLHLNGKVWNGDFADVLGDWSWQYMHDLVGGHKEEEQCDNFGNTCFADTLN